MIRDGLSLIDTFYKGLLSDLPSEECPPVFETGMGFQANSAEAQKEQKDYWDYIKRNRALFLWFDRSDDFLEIYPDSEFFNKSIKVISFYNPSDPINYISGHLEITLETGLDSYDGALKQITFPIELDEEVKASRISFVNIKVNGLYLDYPEGNFARGTRPLCEKLGFSSVNFQYFLRLKQLLVFQCVLIIALLGAILLLTVSIRRKPKLAVCSLDHEKSDADQLPES